VLLDARVRRGGPEVYARRLVAGLRSLDGSPVEILVTGLLGSVGPTMAPALSPWGRGLVAATAARRGADLVHGLHVDAPPGRPPSVVTVQDLIPLDVPGSVPSGVARRVYRRALGASLRRASRVIVPSPATAARLVAHGVEPARVVTVPLGAGPQFRPLLADERDAARREFAGGRRYVAASSGPRPHKNLAGLVAAAAALEADVAVVLTGHGATPGLTFLGRLDDAAVARFYGGAEVMVLPASVEGFGLPALEALACGVAVVCGAGTGAAAYLGDGMLEVDVRRPRELAAALRGLLADDAVRARLGAAGMSQAVALTVQAMARATMAVYVDVLGLPA
jgi:alpha-1,3-rhamnosyl/mannosyltransferase